MSNLLRNDYSSGNWRGSIHGLQCLYVRWNTQSTFYPSTPCPPPSLFVYHGFLSLLPPTLLLLIREQWKGRSEQRKRLSTLQKSYLIVRQLSVSKWLILCFVHLLLETHIYSSAVQKLAITRTFSPLTTSQLLLTASIWHARQELEVTKCYDHKNWRCFFPHVFSVILLI